MSLFSAFGAFGASPASPPPPAATLPLPDEINKLLTKALIAQDKIYEYESDNNKFQRYDDKGHPIFTPAELAVLANKFQRYDDNGDPIFTAAELAEQSKLEFLANLHLTKGYYDEMIEEDETTVNLNEQARTIESLLNTKVPDYSEINRVKDNLKAATKEVNEIINEPFTSQLAHSDEPTPCHKKPVLNKPDSFYSSIFRATKEQDLLNALHDDLRVDITNEESFISSLRNRVAEYLRTEPLPITNGKDLFDRFEKLNDEQYQVELSTFPYWFQKEFPNRGSLLKNLANKTQDKREFTDKIIEHIKTPHTYSCEIDIDIIKTLVRNDILINIINNPTNNLNMFTAKLPSLTKINPTNPNEFVKNIIHLHNTNRVEYEYYSFAISKENFEKLNEDYEFLNEIDITTKENTTREMIATRSSSIELRKEQMRILDESILNWRGIMSLFKYIDTTDKYWTTAWVGEKDFPKEQKDFLEKINKFKIQDYSEKTKALNISKKEIKTIDYNNITIDSFKDMIYNFFTVLNSPETIEKKPKIKSYTLPPHDMRLEDMAAESRQIQEYEEAIKLEKARLAEEARLEGEAEEAEKARDAAGNGRDDLGGHNPYDEVNEQGEAKQQGGNPLRNPLLFFLAGVGTMFYAANMRGQKVIEQNLIANKITEQQNIQAENTIGRAIESGIKLPIKLDYLKYQNDHILKMIDTTKRYLDQKYRNEFKNIIKLIEEIYIPNINELKELYNREIEIYKIVIINKNKELLMEQPLILEIINANREYKKQFDKYSQKLVTSDSRYKELTNTRGRGILGFFGFQGGRHITRKQKNKKQRVSRYVRR